MITKLILHRNFAEKSNKCIGYENQASFPRNISLTIASLYMKRIILILALFSAVNIQIATLRFQLLAPASAQAYKLSGPYEVVARDGEFRASKGGSERDMKAAWDFAKEGKHAEALRIINAYAETLQRLDGHDAPRCLIQGYWLCRAMIIEKENKTDEFQSYISRIS